jgi:hypothetical protein
MAVDTVTELSIEGLRSIENLKLPLRGLAVLIGDTSQPPSLHCFVIPISSFK